MHSTTAAAILFAAGAQAYPHMAKLMFDQIKEKRDAGISHDAHFDVEKMLAARDSAGDYAGFPSTTFDAKAQAVCNSASCGHGFIAPNFKAGDIRGPCPGLNAAANHGYIARNGVTNLQEAIDGTNAVFSMGQDLGGFLSLYSVISDGDILTQKWSIGGQPPSGTGLGLSGSHNKYETDSSPMRGDLYQKGNNFLLQMDQFNSFYNRHRGEADPAFAFDTDILPFRKQRFTESVEQNPYFYYGPFTGIEVSQAAFTFIRAFMSNYSAEHPNGRLNRKSLRSFMSIQSDNEALDLASGTSNLKYVPGNERIPDNWYKRSPSNPYSIPAFEVDILRVAAVDPRILSVGQNVNGVNTYLSVPPTSTEAYAVSQLASNPTALNCFVYQTAQLTLLDTVKQGAAPLLAAAQPLISKFVGGPANCPAIGSLTAPPPKTPSS